ncbi:MAG: hypothetical protein B7Y45_07250 [Sphingomonas sp. 28-66-16]|nr:MAG: hypothetical protein B7Y45_07250 [Sphingomonas sp. 28-66-16]
MSKLRRLVTSAITSPHTRAVVRARHRVARGLRGGGRSVTFFCQIDDPYGPIALRLLDRLAARYDLDLDCRLVPPPDAGAAPEAGLLADYAVKDTARLAAALGMTPPGPTPPDGGLVAQAQRLAAAALPRDDAAAALIAIATALRQPDAAAQFAALAAAHGEATPADTETALDHGAAQRRALGHYLGSTSYFEGEFYWGADRLPYLEARLRDADDTAPPLCPLLDVGTLPPPPTAGGDRPRLDCYLSFRSPYSLIAAERIGALAKAYDAALRLRFVLPMVMRGLPVPRAKTLYITLDTKREAERHGIAFGTIVDPVGAGVERGLAVLHHAIELGKGLDFAISFLRAAFAEGVDMTSDKGLLPVAARVGIDAATVHGALADPSWRAVAEANRADLFALGLWGVPSFQVDDRPAVWGQDRLWVVEDDLRDARGVPQIDRRMK